MKVAQLLERSALYHADRTALVAGNRRWTYRELDDDVSALAGGLAALGLKPGERLGPHLPTWPEFALAYYAAQKCGLVPAVAERHLQGRRDRVHRRRRAAVKALWCSPRARASAQRSCCLR